MTNAEAWKIGFLLRCAEEGLGGDQIAQRIKQAGVLGDILTAPFNVLSRGADAAGSVLENSAEGVKHLAEAGGKGVGLAVKPFPLAMMGGAGLGAGLGYAAAKLQDDPMTTDEAKMDEQIAAYRRVLDHIAKVRSMRGGA